MRDLGCNELQVIAARLVADIPAGNGDDTMTNVPPSVATGK